MGWAVMHRPPALADLPVAEVYDDLAATLAQSGMAVLQAPPGAGKTTGVPLDLLARGAVPGRLLILEPRRLAARAAAERMAALLGEAPGGRVGYRMRGEARIGAATRIEVVTQGILTRMIQDTPDLPGIGALIFDEFHERSLDADLGLALALQARATLRPDLRLLVMSATLDGGPVAAFMGGAPVVTAEGRAFPVETRWLSRPADPAEFDRAVTRLTLDALDIAPGDALVFLPGEAEIRRVAARLGGRVGRDDLTVLPLYGALPVAAQRAALAPLDRPGRKVVLATAIAETSLTIPGIRIVVDGGRARRSRFDPASGMSRLVTERVTRAEAAQRAGRAGRTAPGIAFRLWTAGEEGALAAFPPPEIAIGDLAPLALELALWGDRDLPFLTPPPAPPLAEARALLADLGATDAAGRITDHGRVLARLPLHPRLGHMLAVAGPAAAPLAALLADRDPLPPGSGPDLALRLAALDRPGSGDDRATLDRIRSEAQRLAAAARPPGKAPPAPAAMAALAYPDRIAHRRAPGSARFLMSGGKGAVLADPAAFAGATFLVATDLDGDPREARIRLALPLDEADLRAVLGDRIVTEATAQWSRRDGRVIARHVDRLGALILAERPWSAAPAEALAAAALAGFRDLGIGLPDAARQLLARIRHAAPDQADLPGEAALAAGAADWLLPALWSCRSEADLRAADLLPALRAHLDPDLLRAADRLAPASFRTPLDRHLPIDYLAEEPGIAVRVQEMFGVTEHPVIGRARRPLRITLLSPAGRPIQITRDLPGFWATSWAEVRKELRGRYPKHPWPEDPAAAPPTLRAKPRT
jgi:ATP-dependent helicase HrpB